MRPWTWPRAFGSGRPTAVDQHCWVAPDSAPPADFSLIVHPLELGQQYHATLEFYGSAGSLDLADPARAARDEIGRRYSTDAAISDARADSIVDRVVGAYMDSLTAGLASIGRVEFINIGDAGNCGPAPPPKNPLSPTQKRALLDAAIAGALAPSQAAAYARDADTLHASAFSIDNLVARLRTLRAKERGTLRAGAVPTLRYTDAQLEALRAAVIHPPGVDEPPPLSPGAIDTFTIALASPSLMHTSGQATADGAQLNTLVVALQAMEARRKRYAAYAAQVKAGEAPTAVLRNAYFSLATATLDVVPWDVETELRKVQIGTAYGGGFAKLDIGHDASDDGFAFLMLKFYAAAVDKSLPNPWSSERAHWAFDLGAVSKSVVRYRGQTQDDAIAGLKPLVGLSYDVQRRIAAHGGLIFFRQPSVNPLAASDRKRLRAAPFLGLGFDFDALNELVTMLGGNKGS
ncbi:MAG: hypothetical protein HOQ09_00830 [Gemmatimonadaceae bacterium]|nr:hypothetical protein [Gemmatimonadaceae bacterium]